jgi:protein SCO1/2
MIALYAALALSAAPAPSDIRVDERLGEQVPLDLELTDERGHAVHLGDYFDGKPVLLILAYYDCPMLCGLVLRGAAAAMQAMSWEPGREYRVLTVSFDPHDTPERARKKQAEATQSLGRAAPVLWPFLTGRAGEVERLAHALGFVAVRDDETGQYGHPAVLFVLTPTGRISRYLYGIEPPVRDVKLALLEASAGKTGTSLERLVLRCYAYDPAMRRYMPFISGFLRLGGLGIFAALAAVVTTMWRRERRR